MTKRGNGEGSVYRFRGAWAAQCYVTQVDGRRVRRTVTGATKREVTQKLDRLLDREATGRRAAPLDLTVERYLNEWLDQVVSQRVRPSTLRAYRLQATRYLIPGLGRVRLHALSAREVRLFLDSLRRAGIGARTIVYVHATLRAALADALREELVERNVATLVKVARPAKTEPAPLSVEEVKQLLTHVHDHRLRAMFVVFALLGLRRSEVLGLQWMDINLEDGWLQIRRGLQRLNGKLVTTEPKTARSRRTIPLPAFVVESLKAHRKAQEGERQELAERWPTAQFVFTTPIGTPLDPRNCTRIVQNECERAGLRRVRLHDFRHGAVSVLLGLGVPPRTVMEIVGHSTIDMTMNVYAHVSLDEKREALDLVGELFGEGGK